MLHVYICFVSAALLVFKSSLPASLARTDSFATNMAANMINAIDSEVAFEALVKRRGLANLWPRFEELGWTSAASFAYVLGVNYSNVAEEMFIDKIVCVMLRIDRGAYDARVARDGKDPKERLLLSRLFGEAQRMLHVSLKALEGPGETPPHINDADRTQRRKAYATQIQNAGLYFEDETRHAHCIEDDAFLMLQRGHLSYLHPKHCPTRDQEVALEHLTNKSMRPDAPGFAEFGKIRSILAGRKRGTSTGRMQHTDRHQ